jgi:hypothetical protein
MHWRLAIEKQMGAVGYNDRLAMVGELRRRTDLYGVNHKTKKAAEVAAFYISKNPLVVKITVTKVQETSEGVWRYGVKTRD